jgi:hypothetical protein
MPARMTIDHYEPSVSLNATALSPVFSDWHEKKNVARGKINPVFSE